MARSARGCSRPPGLQTMAITARGRQAGGGSR
jgi:hypothetical protein